jgi:hypothetical protein
MMSDDKIYIYQTFSLKKFKRLRFITSFPNPNKEYSNISKIWRLANESTVNNDVDQ